MKLAAALTCRFGRMSVFGMEIGLLRWDVLVDALNRYPYAQSTAARWVVPALRNLVAQEREAPQELWWEWTRQHRRLLEFGMHPRSPRRAGSAVAYSLLDYENPSLTPPVDRTALQRWQIRAHLARVDRPFTFGPELLSKKTPEMQPSRLNALTHAVRRTLAGDSKVDFAAVIALFRAFLLNEGANGSNSSSYRQRYRDALKTMDEAILQNLTRRYRMRLSATQVREYDRLLLQVRQAWKEIQDRRREERFRRRLGFIRLVSGLTDEQILALTLGTEIEKRPPREVAAMLLRALEELGPGHPQTIFEALAEARKADPLAEEAPPAKRRGRPPRPKNI